MKVALAAGTDLDSLPFRVRLSLRVAEEDGVSSADPIPLATTAGSRLEELEDGFWRGTVTADEPVRIDFESDPYDSSWTVQFVPEVLPVEEKSA